MPLATAPRHPAQQLRLHLGAHKTATTHLQDTLEAARGSLLAQGVDFLPLASLRPAVQPLNNRRKARWWLRGAPMRRAWAEALAPLRRGPGRLVLSEENFLGGCHAALSPTPYPEAARRLRPLTALADSAETTVFFAIRAFDEMLAASYAETLRHRPWPEDFAQVRARALHQPPSWLPVLTAIRRAFPHAALRIWRHEDYRANGAAIRAALCGVAPAAAEDLPPPIRTRTPGAAAIARAAALPETVTGRARLDAVGAMFDASCAAQEPRWSPFDDAQIQVLRTRYAADIATIDRLFPGALMRFDPARPMAAPQDACAGVRTSYA